MICGRSTSVVTGLNEIFGYLILVRFHSIIWFGSLLYRVGTFHLFCKIFLLVIRKKSKMSSGLRVCLLPEKFADKSLPTEKPYIPNLFDTI